MNNKLTVYSTNEESFPFNSFGDLLDELASEGELEVGRKYYSVEATDITPGKYICVDAILEQLDEYVYEDIGELYDNDFSNAPRHAKDELKVFMLNWAHRYIEDCKILLPEYKLDSIDVFLPVVLPGECKEVQITFNLVQRYNLV